jgi:hypothetical protein
MSALEDRARRALHEVADAVVVSDTDLRRLEEDVMTLLDTGEARTHRPRRPRRALAITAAAAVVVLVLAGLALWRTGRESAAPVPAQTSTADDALRFDPAMVGLWRNGMDGDWLWEITADGHMGRTNTAKSYLYAATTAERLVAREDEVYDVVGTDGCVLSLRFRLEAADTATMTVLGDSCGNATPDDFELDRVSGRSPSSAPLLPARPAGTPRAPASVVDLTGSWLEPETGTLLVLDSYVWGGGVSYLVDDDGDGSVAPDQRGTVALTTSGATAPVPNAAPPGGCAPVFTRVTSDRATMTTTAGEGGCFPAGTTQTWIALN